MSVDSTNVVIIGAGHNGLTAALKLARAGRNVLVLERRDIIGGIAAGEEFHPGYRTVGLLHDSASVRPDVVRELGLEANGLRFAPQPPGFFAPASQGRGLVLTGDVQRDRERIFELWPRDADRYVEWRAFLGRVRPVVCDLFSAPPPDVLHISQTGLMPLMKNALSVRRLGAADMLELLRIFPMSLADWLGEWFKSGLLKAALALPALLGRFAGPRSPGTAANLLIHECTSGGAVIGGPAALVAALERAAETAGVTIRTGAEVRRIVVADGRVTGVELRNGETTEANTVAAACDPKRVFLDLLTNRDIPAELVHHAECVRARGTTAKVNLALDRPPRWASRPDEQFECVRIAPGLDAIERAFDAAKYGNASDEPVLDVHMPTFANPGLAPEGRCVLSVLAHFAPFDVAGGWNYERRKELGHTVVDLLERYAPGLRDSIVAREVLSPADLHDRYGLTGGHVHHAEHALDQLLVRPTPETARYTTPVRGLFLCGSGSFPGGGITCAPGALAATAILNGATT